MKRIKPAILIILTVMFVVLAFLPLRSQAPALADTIIIWHEIPSHDGFRIKWETRVPSNSQIEYGPTQSLGTFTPIVPDMVYRHDVKVLVPMSQGTIYYFRAISKDAEGNLMMPDIERR